MIESALRTYLLGISAITNLVEQRIYAQEIVEAVSLPAVFFTYGSEDREYDMSGDQIEFVSKQLNLEIVSDSYDTAKAISKQLRLALSGLTGTYSGVVVRICTFEGEKESVEAPENGEGISLSIISCNFDVIYVEDLA